MVSAIDGDMKSTAVPDKFRIKIWNSGGVIYDNNLGASDNADATTALGGGSIVIHEVKKNTAKMELVEKKPELIPFDVITYPNPSNYQFTLVVEGGSNEKVEVLMYDVLGRMVKHIDNSNGQQIKFGEGLPSGVYIAIVSQGINQKVVNLIKQ
jgi:hypothetical protein